MNNLRKSSTMLIIQIVLSIITSLILLLSGTPLIIVFIAPAIVIVCLLSSYFKEKKSDKKAGKIVDNFNNYFNSAEWRKKYADYIQNYKFEKANPKGMKYDLKKRYRKTIFGFLIFCETIIVIFTCYILFSVADDTKNRVSSFIFLLLIGTIIFYSGMTLIIRPVKNFYRENYDFSTIENSYKNGKIMTYKKSGINIGRDYTIIYDEKRIFPIKNINIQYVERSLVRRKTYYNGDFTKDKYFNKLYIKTYMWEYTVELNEYQIETAINYLRKEIL